MKGKQWYAVARWSVADILAICDKTMTREKAAEFLERHQKQIVDDMVDRGWSTIETLLDDEGFETHAPDDD